MRLLQKKPLSDYTKQDSSRLRKARDHIAEAYGGVLLCDEDRILIRKKARAATSRMNFAQVNHVCRPIFILIVLWAIRVQMHTSLGEDSHAESSA